MSPTIHLVRHAEGYHNVAYHGEDIHDPFLTDRGKQQAQNLCKNFPYHDSIDLLMASPMKRTIQTCQFAFQPAVERLKKIRLEPLAQETSDTQMYTGSIKEEIVEAFGNLVDTERLDTHPYWARNIGIFEAQGDALIERARLLRRLLRDRPESNIGLVSHGSFAHYIVGNVSKDGEETTRMWTNTECRSYSFVSDDDDVAEMVETEESKGKRPDLEKKSEGYVLSKSGPRRNSAGAPLSPE